MHPRALHVKPCGKANRCYGKWFELIIYFFPQLLCLVRRHFILNGDMRPKWLPVLHYKVFIKSLLQLTMQCLQFFRYNAESYTGSHIFNFIYLHLKCAHGSYSQ